MTTDTDSRQVNRSRRAWGDPPLAVPAVAFAVLTIAYALFAATSVRPATPPDEVLAIFEAHTPALKLAGFLQLAAAFALAVFAATAYRRLRALGVTAPGAVIAFTGGILTSVTLIALGMLSWTAGVVAPVIDAPAAKTLAILQFAAGGPAYAVSVALLVAGLAVPSARLGLLPKPLAWAGVTIAALASLSVFYLLTEVAGPAMPIGRFGGLLWVLAAAVLLPGTRPGGASSSTTE